MKPKAYAHWTKLLWTMLLGSLLPTAMLADIFVRGRVTEAVTGNSITDARVTLDLVPPDAVPEASAETDAFGLYSLGVPVAGTYRLRIERGGYVAHEEVVTLAADAALVRNLALAPGAPGLFDLSIEVSDVLTGVALGGLPVVVERFNGSADATPAEVFRLKSDAEGRAQLLGIHSGFFRFLANSSTDNPPVPPRPKWFAFASPKTGFVGSTHVARLQLKPDEQNLLVKVVGFDPRSTTNNLALPTANSSNAPLANVIVEITAVDPGDTSDAVLPTMTSVTDANGEVLFNGLPAVPLRYVLKRMGYVTRTNIIQPDLTTGLFTSPAQIKLFLKLNNLFVQLRSPYQVKAHYAPIPMRLQGLPGTDTEGVDRSETYTYPQFPDQRAFFNLLPGRYRISMDGGRGASGHGSGIVPAFQFHDVVDVTEGGWTDVEAQLQPQTAVIRGRLFAADHQNISPGRERGPNHDLSDYRPRQQAGIELVEFARDTNLVVSARMVMVDTDEAGNFSLNVPPARYGVRIPGMTNYWGSHVTFTDRTNGEAQSHGWPFAEWFGSSIFPRNGAPNSGRLLLVQSSREYTLDLYVRRQVAYLAGTVDHPEDAVLDQVLFFGGNATATIPCNDLVIGGGVIRVTPADGSPAFDAPLTDTPISGASERDANFLIEVPAGTYRLQPVHPRYTFTIEGQTATTKTTTVSPWTAPGVQPPISGSGDDNFVQPLMNQFPVNFRATLVPSTTSVTLLVRRWNEVSMTYEPVEPQTLGYPSGPMRIPYMGSRIMVGSQFPVGPFEAWFPITGKLFGQPDQFKVSFTSEGQQAEFAVKVGGPDDNLSLLPTPAYDLTLSSVSEEDSGFVVPGTTVTLFTQDGEQAIPVSEQTITGFKGTAHAPGVANPNWASAGFKVEIADSAKPRVKLILYFRRGFHLMGTVKQAGTGTPLAGAKVQATDRFGRPLYFGEAVTDATGKFDHATPFDAAATHFVDVVLEGFKPWRQRFGAGSFNIVDPANPQLLLLDVNAELEPLPAPQVTQIIYDRAGPFLAGVSRTGDETIRNGLRATGALTLGWVATATAAPFTYELPQFDLHNGTPAPTQSYEVNDAVAEVWLVDPRVFEGSPFHTIPFPLPVPAATDVLGLRRWLKQIREGTIADLPGTATVFHFPVDKFTRGGPPNSRTFRGEVPIWTLPEGDVRPLIVAVSQLGAVSVLNQFANPATPSRLKGIHTPPWLARATDLMASTAALAATQDQLAKWVPDGRFLPLPNFTATIQATPEGFLNYDYGLDIEWNEGLANPGGNDGLDYLPSIIGLSVEGKIHFGLHGKTNEVFLDGSAKFGTTGKLDGGVGKRYKPPFAKQTDPITLEVSVAAKTASSFQFAPVSDPYEFEMEQTFGGSADASVDLNLTHALKKLSTVGTVLKKLKGFVDVHGHVGAGIELNSRTVWRTPFPPPRPGSTVGELNQVFRRSFLGESEEEIILWDLCLRAEVSAGVSDSFDIVGADLSLFLTGDRVCASGKNSLTTTFNFHNDWPWLTHVNAKLTGTVDAHLNLWVTELTSHYEIDLITIDRPFGTEAAFDLVPLRLTQSRATPATAMPAKFNPSGQNLVEDFFPAGSFAATGGSGDALVFTDLATDGRMTLKFSRRDRGGSWSAPAQLASAPGIVGAAVLELPAGGWLAAWSQLGEGDVGNPFPATSLWSATADAAGVWSAPAQLAALPDVAHQLRLVTLGGSAGLVFLRSADGPQSELRTLAGTVRTGESWNAPSEIVPQVPITGFAVAGAASPGNTFARIAFTQTDGSLLTHLWPSDAAVAPQLLATGSLGEVALIRTAADRFFLAHVSREGAIQLHRAIGPDAWTSLSTPITGQFAGHLQMAALEFLAVPQLIFAWTSPGDTTRIWTAFTDDRGAVVREPQPLTTNTTGRYSTFSLQPQGDSTVTLLARYSSTTDVVQQFTVPMSPSEPIRLEALTLFADGSLRFTLTGAARPAYRVEVSGNLVDWTEATTITGQTPPITVTLPADAATARFVRVTVP